MQNISIRSEAMLSWKKYTTNAHAHKGQSHSPYVWDFPQIVVLNRLTTFKRLNNKLRESLHTNRASFAIALGKSVAADLLRFADKSAHKVRSCMSVCFIKCELESRYLHHLRLRMKYSWLLYRLYNIYGGFYSPIDIIEP